MSAARPELIRALNEQLLLDHIRGGGPCSRAELARVSGLSKSTVSLALANVERAGLIREAGRRRGVPGRAAQLYEIAPDAGFVLALDVGRRFLRGALADLTGTVVARRTVRSHAAYGPRRVTELAALAEALVALAGIDRDAVTQSVIGCPGGYDRTTLRRAFGASLMVENDVDAAALAEQAHGHGREVTSFAFVSVGTGIGMGLVLDGRLHRGAHGVAGQIAFLPLVSEGVPDNRAAAKRGSLGAAASSAAVAGAARRAGMSGPLSAHRVFRAAANGDTRAAAVVAAETALVARAICAVVAVVDPELVVLAGGIGQAPGFAGAVAGELAALAPVSPPVLVSALGADAVVDGCLAAGLDRTWRSLTAALPGSVPVAGFTRHGPTGRLRAQRT